MKCINCGANYDDMMNVCPYCNTVNSGKKAFYKRKKNLERTYDSMAAQMVPQMQKKSANTVLNRVLFIEILVIVLLFVASVVIEIIDSNTYSRGITKGMKKSECIAEIKKAYQEKDFERVCNMYYDGNLYGEDGIELERSMAVFYSDYERFTEYRGRYIESAMEEDIDDSTINMVLNYINAVLRNTYDDEPSEYDKQNKKYFDEMVADVEAFGTGVLKLTDDEMEQLSYGYMKEDLKTQLRKAVKSRRQVYAE